MRVKWGVIGCGDIVFKRACPAMVDQPDSEVVAFSSRTLSRAQQLTDVFGGKRAYDNLEALAADEEVNAVYVASPVHRHREETIACLESGKHVLCEKPMALDTADSRDMIAAADRNGLNLAVAYYRRYYPKTQKMKEIIESGALGQIVRAFVFQNGNHRFADDDPKRWRAVAAEGGGGLLMDIGSHRLDVLCHLLGEPLEVVGFADRVTREDIEVADIESLVAKMANGAHVTGMWNWDVPGGRDDMEVHGTKGSLLASPFDEPMLQVVIDGETTEHDVPKHENVHYPLIDDFARSVVEGRTPTYDGSDGIQATCIMWGAYESARRGRAMPA